MTLGKDKIDLTSTSLSINGTTIVHFEPVSDDVGLGKPDPMIASTTELRAELDALENLAANVPEWPRTQRRHNHIGFERRCSKLTGAQGGDKINEPISGDVSNAVTLERVAITSALESWDAESTGITETLSLAGVLEEDLVVFTTGKPVIR